MEINKIIEQLSMTSCDCHCGYGEEKATVECTQDCQYCKAVKAAIEIMRKYQNSELLDQEPCEDCVIRKDVHEMLENVPINPNDKWFNWLQKACLRLADLPSVKQEPKTGHWIVEGSVDCYLDKVRCHCSECGKKKNFPADYNHISQELHISYKHPELIDNYCPNCGTKMESET